VAKRPVGFRPTDDTTAVFARVPGDAARKLERTAAALRVPKGQVVASLLSALETEGELGLGRVDVPRDAPAGDVMTPGQLAELLQVGEATVAELAERGELPGRRVGREWRFARDAVMAWLAG
jgi:excisionase family DNA binding protein